MPWNLLNDTKAIHAGIGLWILNTKTQRLCQYDSAFLCVYTEQRPMFCGF